MKNSAVIGMAIAGMLCAANAAYAETVLGYEPDNGALQAGVTIEIVGPQLPAEPMVGVDPANLSSTELTLLTGVVKSTWKCEYVLESINEDKYVALCNGGAMEDFYIGHDDPAVAAAACLAFINKQDPLKPCR